IQRSKSPYLFELLHWGKGITSSVQTKILLIDLCSSGTGNILKGGRVQSSYIKELRCHIIILLQNAMGIIPDLIGVDVTVEKKEILKMGSLWFPNTIL